MQNKLFRNCPYEQEYIFEFEQDCSKCPYYRDICFPRKQKLRAQREEIRKENMRKRIVLGLVFFVIVAAIFIYAFCSDAKQSNEKSAMPTENHGVYVSNTVPIKEAEILFESHESMTYSNKQNSEDAEELCLSVVTAAEQVIKLADYSATTILNEEKVVKIKEPSQAPQISAIGPSENYYYTFSAEDKVYMAKLVFVEARGEIFEGKVAVAAVVINRYFSGISWYDTSSIYAVITQKSQFADISEVSMEDLENNPECMQAVEAACKGWDPTRRVFVEGARYFYAPDIIGPEEASRREGVLVLSIGNHNFHNDFAN